MKFGRQCDVMDAVSLGDRSDDFSAIDVDDLDVIAVRYEEAARGGIDPDRVPTPRTSDSDVADDVIVGGKRRGDERKKNNKTFHGAQPYAVPRCRCKQFIGRSS